MDELIKRQDALDALCDACTLASVKSECIFKNLESCMDHNAILDVPAVEEQWIPCSERLPSKADHIDNMVLVCYGNGSVRFNTYMNGWVQGNPVAWMPLPEPYKGE